MTEEVGDALQVPAFIDPDRSGQVPPAVDAVERGADRRPLLSLCLGDLLLCRRMGQPRGMHERLPDTIVDVRQALDRAVGRWEEGMKAAPRTCGILECRASWYDQKPPTQ